MSLRLFASILNLRHTHSSQRRLSATNSADAESVAAAAPAALPSTVRRLSVKPESTAVPVKSFPVSTTKETPRPPAAVSPTAVKPKIDNSKKPHPAEPAAPVIALPSDSDTKPMSINERLATLQENLKHARPATSAAAVSVHQPVKLVGVPSIYDGRQQLLKATQLANDMPESQPLAQRHFLPFVRFSLIFSSQSTEGN